MEGFEALLGNRAETRQEEVGGRWMHLFEYTAGISGIYGVCNHRQHGVTMAFRGLNESLAQEISDKFLEVPRVLDALNVGKVLCVSQAVV